MPVNTELAIKLIITIGAAFIVSFGSTPLVKLFAEKIGAMDIPTEKRRVHDHPIPRMGGLAIFLGFIIAVLLFVDIDLQLQGILLGCVIIVATGAVDDLVSLHPVVKLVLQILSAVVAVLHGVRIEVLMNPFFWTGTEYLFLGAVSIPVTILWIVLITNAVNLIDGLDGLAVGISSISSVTMLIIALTVSDINVAMVLAALMGACIGFMPYNMNPAKIFMGDTGALLLGYLLSTVSVLGLFKFYAVVSFAVPLLAIAVPLMDTIFAIVRRILKGQSPFQADRGHFHHRLIDMGLSQKQAVFILYSISAVLGLAAVVIATSGAFKALLLILGFCLCAFIWVFIYKSIRAEHEKHAALHADAAKAGTDTPAASDAEDISEKTASVPAEGLPDSGEREEQDETD